MSAPLQVAIEGVGAWTPGLADWQQMRTWLRGDMQRPTDQAMRPTATLLPAAERRRAPASVLQAIDVATQATRMAGRDAANLPCVFASAHGDASIMDYMCEVLARAPAELSPTRFHNSVHNAAAGYWTIASACHAASTALCGLEYSFAASLLEAATQVCAEERPVLLVVSDVQGAGPLREVIASTEPFACAFVLAPKPMASALACCSIRLQDAVPETAVAGAEPAALAAANMAAHGLALLQAIAGDSAAVIMLDATPTLSLAVHMELTP